MSEATFIPVFTYAKLNKAPKQNLYRLIREKRLKEGSDYKVIEKIVRRIVINKNLNYEKAKIKTSPTNVL
jgi:hypothetical protein